VKPLPLLWKSSLRYWNTARHLRPVQVYGRALAKLTRLSPLRMPARVSLRPGWRQTRRPFLESSNSTNGLRYTFLNQTVTFDEEVDWEYSGQSKLWRYNLHYFEYLPSLPVEMARKLMEDWVARNVDGRMDAWNPYPLSLRMINWFKWLAKHGETEASGKILLSLYAHARYLASNLEHHLQANHLFENAKALVWAGLVFDGPEANRWLRQGRELLQREVREQVLDDGGHYERSPMYHSLILEGCLDLLNMSSQLLNHAPALLGELERKTPTMVAWLKSLCHPDGEIALFNDAACGIASPPPLLLGYAGAVMGESPEGIAPIDHRAASGYVTWRGSDNSYLVVDVGEVGPAHQPAHGHCDTLSFELSIEGRRIFVDSGVYAYQDPEMRKLNRETKAHNTVRIDRIEQSEIWSSFRIARRAIPAAIHVEPRSNGLHVQGEHTGYDRLGVRHRRAYDAMPGRLEIIDAFQGSGNHLVETYFHLHPSLAVEQRSEKLAEIYHGDQLLARFEVLDGPPFEIMSGYYCPQFGVRLQQRVLQFSTDARMPVEFRYLVTWTA